MPSISIYDFAQPELAELLGRWGASGVHVKRLWKYLYRERVSTYDDMPELPARLRERLERDTTVLTFPVLCENSSSDGLTRKLSLRLAGGLRDSSR